MFEEFIGVNFWTALAVLVNTLLTYAVGRRYLFGPVKGMMDSRQREIDGMYARAGEAEERARALEAEYAQKLSAAEAETRKMVSDGVARGRRREEEIVGKAKAEAAALLTKAAADVAREKKKALNEAKQEISGLALAIAEQVVGRELNGAAQKALVDGFLDGLGELV